MKVDCRGILLADDENMYIGDSLTNKVVQLSDMM